MSDTYWIMAPEQVEALASPVRHDICDRLAAMGPLSVRELSRALGRKPTSIYHHLELMIAVGLVHSSEVRSSRGRPTILYRTIAPRMRMARASEIPENRPLVAKGARAAAATAANDYARAFGSDRRINMGEGRNHWFFRAVASPSPARLARINVLLDELAELVWQPDPEPGPPMSFAWFLSPLEGGGADEDR